MSLDWVWSQCLITNETVWLFTTHFVSFCPDCESISGKFLKEGYLVRVTLMMKRAKVEQFGKRCLRAGCSGWRDSELCLCLHNKQKESNLLTRFPFPRDTTLDFIWLEFCTTWKSYWLTKGYITAAHSLTNKGHFEGDGCWSACRLSKYAKSAHCSMVFGFA